MPKIQTLINCNKKNEIDLKQSFVEALKNPDFQELVSELNTSEELLMKYTSSLVDASHELHNCKACKCLENCPNKIKGYRYRAHLNNKTIQFDYYACKYLLAESKKRAYLDNIELFEISKMVKEASFSAIATDDKERLQIIRYFKEFLNNIKTPDKLKGLYLNGSFGTGKTYMIASLFNELAKREIKSAIVYYPEFLRSLKESFDTDYREKFNYVKKSPILLLDDIGAEVVSSWGRDEILGSILQYRMEEKLPTFFTSNLTLEELEEHLSLSNRGVEKVKARRIIERIKFMTIDMKLISKNRRNGC